MNKETMKRKLLESANDSYAFAVFESLIYYQAIEGILKECIKKSYEILNISSHEKMNFKPSSNHMNRLEKMGLGALVDTFQALTLHKDLCDRIKTEVKNRNYLAHEAAAEFLEYEYNEEKIENCHDKANYFHELATKVSWLYEEMVSVHEEISEIHKKLLST